MLILLIFRKSGQKFTFALRGKRRLLSQHKQTFMWSFTIQENQLWDTWKCLFFFFFKYCINNQNLDSSSGCRLGFERFIANFKFWIKQNKNQQQQLSPPPQGMNSGMRAHILVKLSIFYCSLKTRGRASRRSNLSLTPFSERLISCPCGEGCAGAGLELRPGQAEEDLLGSRHKPQARESLTSYKN